MIERKSSGNLQLTSGRLLAKNVLWNILGYVLPLMVAIFAIPLLVKGLGIERFGILNLVWMVIGYFSLFDLGLGRALTKVISEKLGAGQKEEIASLIWTGLLLMLLLGLIGGLTAGILSSWLIREVIKIPEALQAETIKASYVLVFSIPFVISTAGLRGILEAYQRFSIANAIRIPMGIFNFLAPLLTISFSPSLLPVVAILVVGRIAGWVIHLLCCLRVVIEMRHGPIVKQSQFKPLIRIGGWMTVSNIIGPFMVYLDRFMIGALVSMSAVAYYATPYEVVTKLWFIPGAFVGVLFPAFSMSFIHDHNHVTLLYRRGIKYVFLTLFPIILVIVTLAQDALDLWLGSDFSQESTAVLQWLAVGMLINSLGQIPFTMIQSSGRPDITAKLHLIELPFYLFTIWMLLNTYGVIGAAIAWVVRVSADTTILLHMAQRFVQSKALMLRYIVFAAVGVLSSAYVATLFEGILFKSLFLFFVLFPFAWATWILFLDKDERSLIQDWLKLISFENLRENS